MENESCRNESQLSRGKSISGKIICAVSDGTNDVRSSYGNPLVADNHLIGIFANSISKRVHVIHSVASCLNWITKITGIVPSEEQQDTVEK